MTADKPGGAAPLATFAAVAYAVASVACAAESPAPVRGVHLPEVDRRDTEWGDAQALAECPRHDEARLDENRRRGVDAGAAVGALARITAPSS